MLNSHRKIKLKVTGSVRAFRPVPKPPKSGSLLHPGYSVPVAGPRKLAMFVPSQGGAKRTPGPLGSEVRRPNEAGDVTGLV